MLDALVEEIVSLLSSALPDRQPWRALATAFLVLAVAGTIVLIVLALS